MRVARPKRGPRVIVTLGVFEGGARSTQLNDLLHERLGRLGFQVRMLRDRPLGRAIDEGVAHASLPSHVKTFWGSLSDPLSVALACEEAEGAILDLSSAPQALWRSPQEASAEITDSVSPREDHPLKRFTRRLLRWRGTQEGVGKVLLGLFGIRGAPHEAPLKHSLWRPESSSNKSVSGDRHASSPLRIALGTPPLSPLHQPRHLTILAPSAMLESLRRDVCSPEALEEYERASWVPRVIYFDWFLGELSLSRGRRGEPARSALGELDPFVSALLSRLVTLSDRSSELFSSLLRDRLRGLNDHPLSLIGARDLISAIILIHQRGERGSEYWARGDQLTWGSFTQMCGHCLDELSSRELEQLKRSLSSTLESANVSPWWTLGVKWLQSSATHQRSPGEALLAELKRFASTPRGGAAPRKLTESLNPLPVSFNWVPIHALIDELIKRLTHDDSIE